MFLSPFAFLGNRVDLLRIYVCPAYQEHWAPVRIRNRSVASGLNRATLTG